MYEKISILKPFFEDSNREFHIREFGRELRINHMTSRKYLQGLCREGLIIEKKGKYVKNYVANVDNSFFLEYKKFYNKLKILNSGLLNFLDNELNYPVIVLFGSFSMGMNAKNSDIDLFILTETKKELNLNKFEKKLGRKVQLHVFNEKEYERLKKTNQNLVNNIANGVVLRGQFWVLK